MKNCIDCGKIKSRKGNYCKKCGYKHRVRPRGLTYKITKYNRGWGLQAGWNKGRRSKEFKGKTKDGLHTWVERNLGKPKKCSKCGTKKSKIYQWSNISGEYKAEINDWQRLCVKCHCRYDYQKFGARKEFYT